MSRVGEEKLTSGYYVVAMKHPDGGREFKIFDFSEMVVTQGERSMTCWPIVGQRLLVCGTQAYLGRLYTVRGFAASWLPNDFACPKNADELTLLLLGWAREAGYRNGDLAPEQAVGRILLAVQEAQSPVREAFGRQIRP